MASGPPSGGDPDGARRPDHEPLPGDADAAEQGPSYVPDPARAQGLSYNPTLPPPGAAGNRSGLSANSSRLSTRLRGGSDQPVELESSPMLTPRSSRISSMLGIGRNASPRVSAVGELPHASLEEDGARTVRLNDSPDNSVASFPNNSLRTAKYTALDWLPKALYEQFKRLANFYFLIVACVSFIPGISPNLPIANVFPLLVVVGFGFARDLYEDARRALSDRSTNAAPQVIVARNLRVSKTGSGLSSPTSGGGRADAGADAAGGTAIDINDDGDPWAKSLRKNNLNADWHRTVRSRDIAVGDIVYVKKGEVFPADMVLLHSSEEGGVAYVSTANLDGESNLKRQVVAGPLVDMDNVYDISQAYGSLTAKAPDLALHKFEGSLSLENKDPAPLDSSNLLLRGSILRNTAYIYGMAVYTGYDTKVALNMRHPPSKMGQTEVKLNQVVLFLFGNLSVLIAICAIASGVLQSRYGEGQWYMGDLRNAEGVRVGLRGLGTFLILFSTYIPVSLFVTLEFVRVVQGVFMTYDAKMKTKGQAVAVRATNLNEVLGQIEFVLSDKTGTLTENIMRYIACSAGGHMYSVRKRSSGKKPTMDREVDARNPHVVALLRAMALCHSVVPEPPEEPETPAPAPKGRRAAKRSADMAADDGVMPGAEPVGEGDFEDTENDKPEYQGQSPDEVALVTSARTYGVELVDRTLDSMIINEFGVTSTYEALAELEFNSDRKRMSMLFRCPDGKIRMYTKGADTIMMPLLNQSTNFEVVQHHIDEFAKDGLRTLVYASKELNENEFNSWFQSFNEARNSITNREERVSELSAQIEQDLDYLAVTAVEDKLQDRVPETIKFLREAGIGLWVLTGDKRETAENIGYSANLLDRKMNVIHVKAPTSDDLKKSLDDIQRDYVDPMIEKGSTDDFPELAIIIDGASLAHALSDHAEAFLNVSKFCKTIICCRVTPLQKALVVRMVRQDKKLTLAIGDGGNDVSMIQEAHIGIGLFGKEGTQAARAGDYALSEFKHLQRLLAIHGRYSYIRTAGMINLSFYKNILFTLTQVLFQIFDFVSGTTWQNQWIASAFNVVVTAASPFLFGVYERDLEESTLLKFPQVYQSNRGGSLFSLKSVAEYTLLYGVWHCFCVFFGVFFGLGYLTSPFSSGQDGGMTFASLGSAVIIVVISLVKFAFHSHNLNWLVLFALGLSFLVFFSLIPLSITILNEYPLEGLLTALFTSPAFYLTAVGAFVAAYIVDMGVLVARQVRNRAQTDHVAILQRWEKRNEGEQKARSKQDKLAGREELSA